MLQQELFGVAAQCTGLSVIYNYAYHDTGLDGFLHILPHWSKRPRQSGELNLAIDEGLHDVVPELAWEAFRGFESTDPGYFIPRRVKNHLQNYKDATDSKL